MYERGKETYRLDKKWGVNVQPYSGSPANCFYNGLVKPHDRIGIRFTIRRSFDSWVLYRKKNFKTSVFYESFPYRIKEDGYIDYNELESLAKMYKPKLIICGASAYPVI